MYNVVSNLSPTENLRPTLLLRVFFFSTTDAVVLALLADLLPHAPCAHALTSVHDFVLSLCFGAWVAQAQLLCFFAYAQYGTVVGLWLWYPVVTHVYGVDNVAHVQGALGLSFDVCDRVGSRVGPRGSLLPYVPCRSV